MMLGRVTAFGTVIVAAGKPRYVFHAAIFTLLSNLVLSIPALFVFGFIGPALGTVVAFVPSIYFYCLCIARAAGLRLRDTFPLWAYGRVLATGAVSCVPAVAIKLTGGLGPAASLGAIALAILGSFALLGSLTRQIRRDDWRFLGQWLRGGFASA
jgi:O-antigen/teichoic acid export membrane protein